MGTIHFAFWNLQNLFDTKLSDIAADFEYTPAEGWDDVALEAKLTNLASIISQMNGGKAPDLLGICEVETKDVADELRKKIGRPDLELAHDPSPDFRGIDCALIYSSQKFELGSTVKGHLVHSRYPTRDIFQVDLKVKENGADLSVLVNHWPSRSKGRYETEPNRIAVAEHCGRIVDEILKLSKNEFQVLPDTSATLDKINDKWNGNVLVMGDFNDEPYDRSIVEYLQGTKDEDHLEELIKPASGSEIPALKTYLGKEAYLFNCMWHLFQTPDRGTHHFGSATNSMNMLDQVLVSRGLYYGEKKLQVDPKRVSIFTAASMTTNKGRPREFKKGNNTGFSDHFPIEGVMETL